MARKKQLWITYDIVDPERFLGKFTPGKRLHWFKITSDTWAQFEQVGLTPNAQIVFLKMLFLWCNNHTNVTSLSQVSLKLVTSLSHDSLMRACKQLISLKFVRASIEYRVQSLEYRVQSVVYEKNSGKEFEQEEPISLVYDPPPVVEPHTKKVENIIQSDNTPILVIEYLNQKANLKFKPVAGNLKHINARIKEGYSLEDFKKVVDCKVTAWADNPTMCKYLRPTTLFNSEKFDGYLNEINLEEKNNQELRKVDDQINDIIWNAIGKPAVL